MNHCKRPTQPTRWEPRCRWLACWPWFIGFLFVWLPSPAFANVASGCQPEPLSGPVRKVVVSEATADYSSAKAVRKPRIRSITEVTSDARTATTVETHVEDPDPQVRASSFTSTRRFDDAHRMTEEIVTLGSRTISTTSCTYDDQGRLIRELVQSSNPGLARTTTYSYGPSSREELFVTDATSIRTRETFDEDGRLVLRERHDERKDTPLSTTEYAYLREGVNECTQEPGKPRGCRLSIRDVNGNEIESRSNQGITRTRYEYDHFGNWIMRVRSMAGGAATAEWRSITYW